MNDVDAIAHLGLRHSRRAAGGDDHCARTLIQERLAVYFGIEPHLDARAFDFGHEIRDDAAELGAMRKKLGDQGLTAEARALFAQCDLKSALGRGRCCFHAAWSAANDQHLARASRWVNRSEFKLASGFRMLDTGDRNAKLGVADASLIAGD